MTANARLYFKLPPKELPARKSIIFECLTDRALDSNCSAGEPRLSVIETRLRAATGGKDADGWMGLDAPPKRCGDAAMEDVQPR
jgi:hypothetical protein